MKRYNVQTSPELSKIQLTARTVTYTKHARTRATEKGIILAKTVVISAGQVVECEVINNRLSKLVVRQSLDKKRDRVMVLVPNGECWTCVTVWANNKDDNHSTLDKTRISA